MNITTEELKTLYERARDYAVVYNFGVYKKEPTFVELRDDGTIGLEFVGAYQSDVLIITAENLAEDSDAIIKARQKSEERAKNERRKQYEELRKEFEQEGKYSD